MSAFLPIASLRRWFCRKPDWCVSPGVSRLGRRETIGRVIHAGQTLQCLRGVLWITSDRDQRDILLREGERFRAGPKTRLLIEALDDSVVRW